MSSRQWPPLEVAHQQVQQQLTAVVGKVLFETGAGLRHRHEELLGEVTSIDHGTSMLGQSTPPATVSAAVLALTMDSDPPPR